MTDDMLERLRVNGDQPDPLFEDRVCANPACGRLLERRPGESVSNFKRRTSCGSEVCKRILVAIGSRNAAAARTPDLGPARSCPVCDKPLERRLGEDTSKFRKRKTCSNSCGNRLRSAASVKATAARKAQAARAESGKVSRSSRADSDAARIREEWERSGQWGMTRDSIARMLNVSRTAVDNALDGAA